MRDSNEAATRARVEAVFAAVDRVGPDRLDRFAVALHDAGDRAERLDRLEALAEETGRAELLDEARDTLERELMERWTSHLRLAYGAESTMTGRADDRAAAVTALRDLVAVAVMRDRLDPADAEALAERGVWLLDAGSLDGHTTGRSPASDPAPDVPDPRPGAPTDDDWRRAAAEHRESPAAPRRTSPVVSIVVGGVALVVLAAVLLTQLAG